MIEVTLNIPEEGAREAIGRMSFSSMRFHARPEVVKIIHEEFENAFRVGGFSLSGKTNAWTPNSREWTERKRREGRSTRKLVYKGDLFRAAIRASIRSVANRLRIEWQTKGKGFDVATFWQEEKKTFRKMVAHPEMIRRLNDEFLQAILEELEKHGYQLAA